MVDGYVIHIDGDSMNNEPSNLKILAAQRWNGRSGGKTTTSVELCPQGGTILCACESQAVNVRQICLQQNRPDNDVRQICLQQNRPDIDVKVLDSYYDVSPDPKVYIALKVVIDEHELIQYFPSEDAHARRAMVEGVPRVTAKSRNYHDWYRNQRKPVPR